MSYYGTLMVFSLETNVHSAIEAAVIELLPHVDSTDLNGVAGSEVHVTLMELRSLHKCLAADVAKRASEIAGTRDFQAWFRGECDSTMDPVWPDDVQEIERLRGENARMEADFTARRAGAARVLKAGYAAGYQKELRRSIEAALEKLGDPLCASDDGWEEPK